MSRITVSQTSTVFRAMFRNLISALSDRHHVIASDCPGFGLSAALDHTKFAYTFAHCATTVDDLLAQYAFSRSYNRAFARR